MTPDAFLLKLTEWRSLVVPPSCNSDIHLRRTLKRFWDILSWLAKKSHASKCDSVSFFWRFHPLGNIQPVSLSLSLWGFNSEHPSSKSQNKTWTNIHNQLITSFIQNSSCRCARWLGFKNWQEKSSRTSWSPLTVCGGSYGNRAGERSTVDPRKTQWWAVLFVRSPRGYFELCPCISFIFHILSILC